MSLPRYPEYKDSGVEWLGEVPAHWDVKRLRRFSCMVQAGPFGSQLHADEYITGGTPLVNPINMVNGAIVPSEAVTVPMEVVKRLPHQMLRVGDVVFSRRGELGRCALVTESEVGWLCGTGSMILRLDRRDFHPGFLSAYLSLDLLRQYFESFSIGAIMDSLSSETLLALFMVVPAIEEQAHIAAFIDRETAKIDALVAEQQRLIELLKEKRHAVISHAVTKGLNPNAPMKGSGIEWLGEIPAHWSLPPLYLRYEQTLGKMLDQAKMTGQNPMPYIRNLDVRWDHINVEDLPMMDIAPHERARFTVAHGDLIMVEGRELGRCAIWSGEDGTVAFQKALHRLRPRANVEHTRFFYYTMVFANRVGVFFANVSPNEIPHLTGEELRKYRFPKPPLDEQRQIASFLDNEDRRYEAFTAEATRAIDLLTERRTALISAAVTGQIDVRPRAQKA